MTRRRRGSPQGEAVATAAERYDRATGRFVRVEPRAPRVVTTVRSGEVPQATFDGVLAMLRAANGGRVRVADVYDRYGDAGRKALRQLRIVGRVALFPIDNRREVTDRDVRAAIDGDHVAYLR